MGAKALFKQAIALDSSDRTVRVGMFSTEYYPNAKLREAEARCPSAAPPTQPVTQPPVQTPPQTPAQPPARPATAPTSTPPVALNITSPQTASLTVKNETDAASISGTVRGGAGGLKVTVNGRDVPVAKNGRFRAYVSLSVGANDFTVNASDSANKGATKKIVITRSEKDATPSTPTQAAVAEPLALTVVSPADLKETVPFDTTTLTVKGNVKGGKGTQKITISNKQVKVASDGSFSAQVPLKVGVNKITVNATDASRKAEAKQFSVTRLAKAAVPPALGITSPSDQKQTVTFETDKISVKGSVSGGEGTLKVTLNNEVIKTDRAGAFSASVPLKEGDNKVVITVSDSAGKHDSQEFLITRAPKPTPPAAPLALNVTSPSEPLLSVEPEVDKIAVTGTVSGGEGAHELTVNNKAVKTDSRGAFSTSIPLDTGDNNIIVKVKDAAGKEESRELRIARRAKVFPPLALSVSSPSERVQSVPFETDKVAVAGTVAGGEGAHKVTINNKEVKTDSHGTFSTSVPLETGDNIVTVKVKDAAGKEEVQEVLVTRLKKIFPPLTLNVASPSDRVQSVTSETDKIAVTGSVAGGEGTLTVTVNNKEVKTDNRGAFSTSIPLDTGDNIVTVKAKDAAGKEEVYELLVTRLKKIFPPPVLSVTSPPVPVQSVPFETDKIVVGGSVKGGEGTPRITVNSKEVKTDGGGFFSIPIPLDEGNNKITVKVQDAAGKEDSLEYHITRIAKVFPPPVLVVASPLEPKQTVPFETDKIDVRGTVTGGKGVPAVTINGQEVSTDSGGSFLTSLPLNVGDNAIIVKAEDSAGRDQVKEFLISRRPEDKPLPLVLSVNTPTDADQDGKVSMQGTVTGGKGELRLVVDGRTVPVENEGHFETRVALKSGKNRIHIWVEDASGRRDSQVWLLFRYPTTGN